jgi:hypothetical protein
MCLYVCLNVCVYVCVHIDVNVFMSVAPVTHAYIRIHMHMRRYIPGFRCSSAKRLTMDTLAVGVCE